MNWFRRLSDRNVAAGVERMVSEYIPAYECVVENRISTEVIHHLLSSLRPFATEESQVAVLEETFREALAEKRGEQISLTSDDINTLGEIVFKLQPHLTGGRSEERVSLIKAIEDLQGAYVLAGGVGWLKEFKFDENRK